ncbi:MAG: transcriptional repressor, partial [Blastocatellia bacterium]
MKKGSVNAAKKENLRQGLRSALVNEGRNFTRQRAAVYEFLVESRRHPTAEDVFMAVRRALPKISLATVYKNLEALVACGQAAKLSGGEGPARYEARRDEHHHARCLSCGLVTDVEAG